MDWEIRAYQQDAVSECVAGFCAGKPSVMLESPVGSGKTYMALETVHRLQKTLGRRLRVNWVAPRRHLLRQVMEANRDLHQDYIRPVSLFEKTPPPADLVVLDEAHHEATQSCVLLYEKMKSEYVLGLSATPLRTDRMKLSFRETVTTCSIDRLVREGYLSPFHSYLLPHYDPLITAECYLDSPEKWGKTLAFFHTVNECHQFRRVLADAGVPCEVVTAESDKDRQLEAFMSGKVKVIANVSMLTEGFDQPDLQTIFARDASRLPTIQMCGRGLRFADGKTHCNVVQSAKTKFVFERVTPAKRRFRLMNGQWMALQDGTAEIEETIKRSLELLELREAKRRSKENGRWNRRKNDGPSNMGERSYEKNRSGLDGLPPYYRRFEESYSILYGVYGICNELCWSRTLPPVGLCLNRRRQHSNVGGVAKMNNVAVDGIPYHVIGLTLRNCLSGGLEGFMHILLHEMTHIWQFSSRRRGGHGADFRNEMMRIGLDERGIGVNLRNGSPASNAIEAVRSRFPDFITRMREIYASDLAQPSRGDLGFFRYLLERHGGA